MVLIAKHAPSPINCGFFGIIDLRMGGGRHLRGYFSAIMDAFHKFSKAFLADDKGIYKYEGKLCSLLSGKWYFGRKSLILFKIN